MCNFRQATHSSQSPERSGRSVVRSMPAKPHKYSNFERFLFLLRSHNLGGSVQSREDVMPTLELSSTNFDQGFVIFRFFSHFTATTFYGPNRYRKSNAFPILTFRLCKLPSQKRIPCVSLFWESRDTLHPDPLYLMVGDCF